MKRRSTESPASEADEGRVLLSATMILRNEEARLPACLDSLAPFVDEIVVVDTGSTDQTPEIAISYGARVLLSRWQADFSYHRNQALEAATGRWALVIDGDEVLVNGQILRDTVEESDASGSEPQVDSIAVDVVCVGDRGPSERCMAVRAFRRALGRYQYPVHNQLVGLSRPRPCAAQIRSFYVGTVAQKVERSTPMLKAMLAENPDSAHAAFFLCKTHWATGRLRACLAVGRQAAALAGDTAAYAPLWVWMYYAALALEGPVEAEAHLAEGLQRHPWYPDLLHTRIVADTLRWNASFSDATKYAFAGTSTSRFLENLPQVVSLLGAPVDFLNGGGESAAADPNSTMNRS